ncbi:KinB signaling pathway activation protein [Aquisalibacillus elongatus]|uniref:KinB signaling pathway activation protein n=1 Tax=Aquisalibacillus elongatus TaxID=485577 RepID=A0A3N5BVW0_9BACI|nr:KinB-signaling pathway activation protein [Aquisalibacillus elongatus]RPF50045.1 KinB signaling pathway activation protein [Aquisalibacillus elongatus]
MTIRKWLKFFSTALLIGAVTTIITSFFVQTDAYTPYLDPFDLWNITGALFWFLGWGLVYSVISQMGFFAYLTIHQFGRGFFGFFWKHVQILLILIVLFDLVYFRYTRADDPGNIWSYILVAALLLIYSYAVAKVKAKDSHPRAFLPALFFMVVVTSVEWIPALREGSYEWVMLMVVPLLACNTYQVLTLHRIVGFNEGPSEKEKN